MPPAPDPTALDLPRAGLGLLLIIFAICPMLQRRLPCGLPYDGDALHRIDYPTASVFDFVCCGAHSPCVLTVSFAWHHL